MYRDPDTGKVIPRVNFEYEGWTPPGMPSEELSSLESEVSSPASHIAPPEWPIELHLSVEQLDLFAPLRAIQGFAAAFVVHSKHRTRSEIFGDSELVDSALLHALAQVLTLPEVTQLSLTRGDFDFLVQTMHNDPLLSGVLILHRQQSNFALAKMKLETLGAQWCKV